MQLISPYNYSNYKFITEQAKELPDEFIRTGELSINRLEKQLELSNILQDINKAIEIENGIFEFALTYCYTNDYGVSYINATYRDKYCNIVQGINDNELLKTKILTNKMGLKQMAFLLPSQLYPEKWECFIEKQRCIKERESNIVYTDAYKCYKCGEAKSKIVLVQTRSADEPMTMYIICLICGNTKKS